MIINKKILETKRLILRCLSIKDAAFILELVNDPLWLQFIGNKGVKNLEDARHYILNGPIKMYHEQGFGLYLTELKEQKTPIGICGLIKRDSQKDIDIGFAFLPKFRSRGFAYEAASAVLAYGKNVLNIERIVAITVPGNLSSIKLLEKIGLKFEQMIKSTNEELMLFALQS